MPAVGYNRSDRSHGSQRVPSALELKTGRPYLERLGILYEHQIRLTIVTELNMREMSPRQFFDQVGGTSYDSVRRHFKKLVEFAWIRKVRTVSSGRGRPEELFRTTELPVIDDESWAEIPTSIRDAFTVQALEEMGKRFGAALTAETSDRNDPFISFRAITLDNVGWAHAMEALERCYRSLAHEQTDAKARRDTAGGNPAMLVVEFAGFELSRPGGSCPPLPTANVASPSRPWNVRLSKVFSNPRNLAIVNALNQRELSATGLHRDLGELSVESFHGRCKILAECGWLAKVDERTGGERRGATEIFYRAARPQFSQADMCKAVPQAYRQGELWGAFQTFCEASAKALESGAFNRRDDRHLTWSALLLDDIGVEQVLASLKACERVICRIAREAAARLSASNAESGNEVGVFIAGFEGPLTTR